ncbi:uncharacterized protein LOC134817926 [Bolinopsis microptera]|uniref:uncharacterized protein LOC134817926 n=1 Tax=Bolinopsis microptera TaxID=2820187 RepID=UPI003079A82B
MGKSFGTSFFGIIDNAANTLRKPDYKCFHREGDGELRYFRPIDGDIPTLENTTELDAIICLGSAKSAYDDDQWMLELCEFFRSIANTKLKLFGSCFGHQLINKAFGGTVTKNVDQGFIFGADGIKISIPEDLGDSAISMLLEDGTSLKMLQSHGDEVVTLGEGARLLGSSERCLNEVVLVRGNILTMQCHPDLTPELMMTNIWPAISGRGRGLLIQLIRTNLDEMRNGEETFNCVHILAWHLDFELEVD